MATLIDVSGLAQFSNIFVFVLVLLVVYAILKLTKVVGDNDGINLVIAFVIALLVLISPIATGIINLISPWFAILFIFIIFASIAFRVMGLDTSQVLGSSSLKLLLGVVVLIIIVVGALTYVRQQTSIPGENETEADYTQPGAVLFHPNIMGAILVLLIAVFTIALMAGKSR
ncbi:MAG: hypothetical protein KJ601_01720 [Nanoarchaeota archaeon]|nr:hypothetical protein [Nanoarchaeota archaeon]MBU1705025.1 hypothetical protein [Nanoarchaeota archaeon]